MLRIHPFDPPLAHSEQDVQRLLADLVTVDKELGMLKECIARAVTKIRADTQTISELREINSSLNIRLTEHGR